MIPLKKFVEAIKKFENLPNELKITKMVVAMACHMEGNLHPTFVFNENDPDAREDFEEALDYLYKEIIIPLGGSITGEHGIGTVKTPYLRLEHGPDVVDLMHEIKKVFDPNMILNPGVGKGDLRPVPKSKSTRLLNASSDKFLVLNCMRCGFCNVECPSKWYFKSEAYSPRGRLNILNALVHGELTIDDKTPLGVIMYACTLCGSCSVKCPAGVQTEEIFEKVRALLQKNEFSRSQ